MFVAGSLFHMLQLPHTVIYHIHSMCVCAACTHTKSSLCVPARERKKKVEKRRRKATTSKRTIRVLECLCCMWQIEKEIWNIVSKYIEKLVCMCCCCFCWRVELFFVDAIVLFRLILRSEESYEKINPVAWNKRIRTLTPPVTAAAAAAGTDSSSCNGRHWE